jgi:hypothetical protein
MAYDPSRNALLYGPEADGIVSVARNDANSSWLNADASYTITVSAVSSLSITINAGSGWSPAVGDTVISGSTHAIVTAVTNSTHFTVSETITTGSKTALVSFTSAIRWLPKFDPTGAVVKRYQSFVTHWDDVYGLYSWTLTFANNIDGASSALAYTRDVTLQHYRSDTRALLASDVALNTQLQPKLTITNADARWRVTGISENYTVATARVSR